MSDLIMPDLDAPDFAYIVARRVTDTARSADAIIFVTGKRGVGKSVLTLGLAEAIALHIANIRGKRLEDFFTIDNVKTVDKTGGLALMGSDALLKLNSVLVLDDAQISLSARRSNTKENNAINDLITICRPFNSVILVNSVFHRNIDRGSRSLADYVISVQYTNPHSKQTVCKVYLYSESNKGDEIKKFLTWSGKDGIKKRLKYFVSTLPSKALLEAYNTKRMENSIKLVQQCREEYLSDKAPTPKHDRMAEIIAKNRTKAMELKKTGSSMKAISRELGLTDYQTSRCLSKEV
jgi:hypothetical protein